MGGGGFLARPEEAEVTRLIEAGVDIITVKELLGHFSVRVTQRYTHPSQDQKKRAVDLLTVNRENLFVTREMPADLSFL